MKRILKIIFWVIFLVGVVYCAAIAVAAFLIPQLEEIWEDDDDFDDDSFDEEVLD